MSKRAEGKKCSARWAQATIFGYLVKSISLRATVSCILQTFHAMKCKTLKFPHAVVFWTE